MIYLDNAASKLGNYGVFNANSSYADDEQIELYNARKRIADVINADPEEIFFTSGGCESNSWAIQGIARANRHKGNHIITTQIEHPSILNCCKQLEKEGFEVTYLPVNKFGYISIDSLWNSITSKTILVTTMHVNNETGVKQSIYEIGRICRYENVIFHTDCVQSMGYLPIDVKKSNIDLLSASGHKFGAPFGVGFLYKKKEIGIAPLIFGGSQEYGLRGGTTNYDSIIEMSHKLSNAYTEESIENKINLGLKTCYLEQKIRDELGSCLVKINTPINRTINILSATFKNIDSEELIYFLNDMGIYTSAGSACHEGEAEISHVLKAIGLSKEEAKGTIRFSLSEFNTYEQIDILIKVLKQYFKFTGGLSEV